MKDKEISLGVCGVVVGLVIGAGAVMYGDSYSSEASLLGEEVAFRGMDIEFDRQAYKRRAVRERDNRTRLSALERKKAEQRRKQQTPKVTPPPQREVMSAECMQKVPLVSSLKKEVLGLIPSTLDYSRVKQSVSIAFNNALSGCLAKNRGGQETVSIARHGVTPVPRVDNGCEQYGRHTQRYTRCLGNERRGQRYVGGQTRRYR